VSVSPIISLVLRMSGCRSRALSKPMLCSVARSSWPWRRACRMHSERAQGPFGGSANEACREGAAGRCRERCRSRRTIVLATSPIRDAALRPAADLPRVLPGKIRRTPQLRYCSRHSADDSGPASKTGNQGRDRDTQHNAYCASSASSA
jgi:hypothetical protein